MNLSNINKFHTIVNKNVLLISLQIMTFCAVFERDRSKFLSIIEWETSMCNSDWSLSLSTTNPRYAFDLHAFCAETLYNYYTRQVHFQWNLTHYNSSTIKSEQMFSGLMPQLWQQFWSHQEKCKHHHHHHHHLLLPRCHC